jgi:hypothetical protein
MSIPARKSVNRSKKNDSVATSINEEFESKLDVPMSAIDNEITQNISNIQEQYFLRGASRTPSPETLTSIPSTQSTSPSLTSLTNEDAETDNNVAREEESNVQNNKQFSKKKSSLNFDRGELLNKYQDISMNMTIEDLLKLTLAKAEKEKNPIVAADVKKIIREINGEISIRPTFNKKKKFGYNNNYNNNRFNNNWDNNNNGVNNRNEFNGNEGGRDNNSKWNSNNRYQSNINSNNERTGTQHNPIQRSPQQRMDNYNAIFAEHMKTRETRTQRYQRDNNKS